MTHDDIIAKAAALINPRRAGENSFGTVASVLASGSGREFTGVCIDTGSGTGFCAEAAAIGAMVTAGEYTIKKVVAVAKLDDGGLYVIPPCGRCREFMRQIDEGNLEAEVVLGRTESSPLKELLPQHGHSAPV